MGISKDFILSEGTLRRSKGSVLQRRSFGRRSGIGGLSSRMPAIKVSPKATNRDLSRDAKKGLNRGGRWARQKGGRMAFGSSPSPVS